MKQDIRFSLLAVSVAIAIATLITACGGTNASAPISGVFLDSAVEGAEYSINNSAKVSTAADGSFTCSPGDKVAFSIGGINLGSAACDATITPMSFTNAANVKDDSVVNRLLALQLFDEDNDPSNGIKLSSTVKTTLANQSLDFSGTATSFNTALTAVLSKLPAAYQARSVDSEKRMLVREHFEDTLASRLGTPAVDVVTQTNGAGNVSASITRYQIQAADSFYVPYEGNNAAIKSEFPKGFLPSFGSGLTFKGTAADGALEFYGITDRGPNGDGPKIALSEVTTGGTGTSDAKFFPSPSFAPSIGVISIGKDGAKLKSSMPIKFTSAINASGLPIAAGKVGSSAEVPLTDAAKYEPDSKTIFSDYGLDTESVVLDTARNTLWVSDEYGPFILKIDINTGIIQKKYQPGTNAGDLPAILAKRRANRGMEGLSLEVATGKLQGFLQSPLDDGKANYVVPGATASTNENIRDYAKFIRWVEFDPATEKTKLYAYPIDSNQYLGGKTGAAKLGDVVSLGGGKFIVIEQGAGVNGKVFNHLMLVQISSNASDIAAVNSDLEKSSMTGAAVNGANYTDVITLKKTLLFNLNNAGWLAEKAEGLALVDANTLALTNDDDFGTKTIVLNAAGIQVEGADITKCAIAKGTITTLASATGCVAGNSARVGRGADTERPNRIWLLKFNKVLADLIVPAQ